MASLESIEVSEEVKVRYKEILKNNGITEPISQVLVKEAGLDGEGKISQVLDVTVKFENPKAPQLNLFVKAFTNNPSHSQLVTDMKAFDKEARFFIKYVPAAKKLCTEKGQLDLMNIYPKCYYGDEKLIVLENLVLDKGYSLHTKEGRLGLEEGQTALLSLAQHHAISYAMIRKFGGGEKFLQTFKDFDFDPFMQPFFTKMMEPMTVDSIKNNMKILEKCNVKGREVTLERIKSIGKNTTEQKLNASKINPNDNFLVLNHGDYHKGNMMFLRDPESQKILQHKIFDLQIVLYNSPGVDLSQFLFSSVKPDIRRKHLKELLSFYFENFKKVVEDLGQSMEYSYEDLHYELRKKLYDGFWYGFRVVGPGQAIAKSLNVKEIKDMSQVAALLDKAFQKWIDDNPEKCEEVAKEIVEIVEEYYELRLG